MRSTGGVRRPTVGHFLRSEKSNPTLMLPFRLVDNELFAGNAGTRTIENKSKATGHPASAFNASARIGDYNGHDMVQFSWVIKNKSPSQLESSLPNMPEICPIFSIEYFRRAEDGRVRVMRVINLGRINETEIREREV